MKPVDVKLSTYIDFNKENNEKDSKFEIGNHVRILKYKNIFAKRYIPNWSGKFFVIKNLVNAVRWTYVINDLDSEDIFGTFHEKELQKSKSKRV